MAEPSNTEPPEAELWPSTPARQNQDPIEIRIYIVTGKHGILKIPERFCRECHLFVRAAHKAADSVDISVNIRVLSWWTRFLGALRYGGYHPPVMVIDGTKLCQGDTVPSPEDITEAIHTAAGR